MKFTITVTPEDNPDAVGEVLRSVFFDEKWVQSRHGPYQLTGCYSTFDWQEDVEPLDSLPVCTDDDGSLGPFDDLKWTRGKKKFESGDIECRYYWDGDGTLAFGFPDGTWLINTDCKKDHGWELVDSLED